MLVQEQSNYHFHVDLFLYSQHKLKDNFIHIQISSYINLTNLLIFFAIQIKIICDHTDIFVFIVLILAIIALILEGISYEYHRYMQTQKLLYAEILIVLVESSIVGISIFQISEGAIERDGSALAWIQLVSLVIFIGVTFYKLVLVYQTNQAFEELKMKLSVTSLQSYIASDDEKSNTINIY